jgi:hypothetical protein
MKRVATEFQDPIGFQTGFLRILIELSFFLNKDLVRKLINPE